MLRLKRARWESLLEMDKIEVLIVLECFVELRSDSTGC